MTEKETHSDAAVDLRRRAEEIAQGEAAQMPENLGALPPEEARHLLHELRVRQIELEMQNDELRRVQDELEDSRERYSNLFDLAPVGYLILSSEGLILETNLTLTKLLGVTRNALIRQPITGFFLPEDQDIYDQLHKELFATGAPQIRDLRLLKKDAAPFWARLEANMAQDIDGKPVCRVVVSDITERKQMEEVVRESEARFEQLLESTSDSVSVLDREWRHVVANEARARFVNLSKDKLLSNKLTELFPGIEETSFFKTFQRVMQTRVPDTVTDEFTFPDGRKGWYEVHVDPVPEGILCISRDVTNRMQADEALRESEERYRALFQNSPVSLWEEDFSAVKAHIEALRTEGVNDFRAYFENHPESVVRCTTMVNIVDVNKATLQLYGARNKDELLSGLDRIFTEESYNVFREELIAIAEGKTRFESEAITQTLAGVRKHIVLIWLVFPGYQKSLSKVSVSIIDITSRKQAEATLSEERLMLRTLIDTLPDNIFIKDRQSRFVLSNLAHIHWLRATSEEELLDKTDFDFYPKELAEKYYADEQAIISSNQALIDREEPCLNKAGNPCWLLTSKVPLCDTSGDRIGIVGVNHDITERKQAEAALSIERLMLRTLIDTLPDNIFIKDRQSRFVLSNLAHIHWLRATSEEELLDKTDFDFYPKELAEKYFADEQSVISSNQALIDCEEPCLNKEGNPCWLLTSKVPLCDTSGNRIGIVGVNHDITERKQAEEALHTLLAEKEVLLREVYHRVKNNLATIVGMLGLQQKVITDPAALVQLQELEDRIHSMALVHEMLYQSESLVRIDLHQYLHTLVTRLQASLDLYSNIHLRVEATGVEMNLDTAIPCGLIVNELVTNAFKHAFPQGQPCLGAEHCEIVVTVTWDGDDYTLVVSDNGVGFPDGMDWTATDTLGLRLVAILGQRQLRGQFELDQAVGTTFRLRFPPQGANRKVNHAR